jgi:hypothetical protein
MKSRTYLLSQNFSLLLATRASFDAGVAVDRLLALLTVIQMLLLVVLSEELVPATYLRLLGPSMERRSEALGGFLSPTVFLEPSPLVGWLMEHFLLLAPRLMMLVEASVCFSSPGVDLSASAVPLELD